MFTLLIKGTIIDAERALVLHGFHPSDWLTQPQIVATNSSHVVCTVDVTDETEPGVIRWFAELPSDPPFPVGTLLHFARKELDVAKPAVISSEKETTDLQGFTRREFTDQALATFLREHGAINDCQRVGTSNQWHDAHGILVVAVYSDDGVMTVAYWVRDTPTPAKKKPSAKRMRVARIGSVSHGTMLPKDLIPTFADELRALRGSVPKALHNSARAFNAGKLDDSGADKLVVELTNALCEFALPYCYFGAHPGNGADYGFWLFEDFQSSARENDALEVSDTSEVPPDYSGEVLLINDHGNATLFNAHKGRLTPVWSVV